jgi:hypothetical protein
LNNLPSKWLKVYRAKRTINQKVLLRIGCL